MAGSAISFGIDKIISQRYACSGTGRNSQESTNNGGGAESIVTGTLSGGNWSFLQRLWLFDSLAWHDGRSKRSETVMGRMI